MSRKERTQFNKWLKSVCCVCKNENNISLRKGERGEKMVRKICLWNDGGVKTDETKSENIGSQFAFFPRGGSSRQIRLEFSSGVFASS